MRIIMCKRARGNLPARDESPAVRDKSAALVRTNPELPCSTESEAGCRSFHPGLPPQRRRPVAGDPGCGRGGLSASASRYSYYGFAIRAGKSHRAASMRRAGRRCVSQKHKARLPKQTGFVGELRGDLGRSAEFNRITGVRLRRGHRHHRGIHRLRRSYRVLRRR